jgi:hypothetical protein
VRPGCNTASGDAVDHQNGTKDAATEDGMKGAWAELTGMNKELCDEFAMRQVSRSTGFLVILNEATAHRSQSWDVDGTGRAQISQAESGRVARRRTRQVTYPRQLLESSIINIMILSERYYQRGRRP